MILWVEREESERRRARRLCKQAGIEVAMASSGARAIQRLRRERNLEAVITGSELPDMSGLKLLAEARELAPAARRILLLMRTPALSKEAAVALAVALQEEVCQQTLLAPVDASMLMRLLGKSTSTNSAESIDAVDSKIHEINASLAEMVNERTRQLEVAKREWEQTFDAINDPVLLIDQHYGILRANLALGETVEQDIRELIGEPCYQVLMGRDSPCKACPMPETLAAQEGQEAELRHEQKETLYHLRSFPLSNDPPYVVHEYRDITEEKALQQMLYQADKLSSIGMLAGRVAHEINNPLAGILAQTQLLLMEVEDEDMIRDLKDIEQAALRCRKIVQDLLNFSRQKPTDRRARHDLNQIVYQTMQIYALLPPKEGPTIELVLAEGLPMLHLDPDKTQSILLNLLSNAKAATPASGTITVQTMLDDDEKNVILSVKDTGEGIPPQLREKILMPFFTTKAPGLGTGLGLYIVQEAVKEHEGTLTLDSEVGVGSEFRVYLPI